MVNVWSRNQIVHWKPSRCISKKQKKILALTYKIVICIFKYWLKRKCDAIQSDDAKPSFTFTQYSLHIFWYFKIQFVSINSLWTLYRSSMFQSQPFLFLITELSYWCIFMALLWIIYRSMFDLCQSLALSNLVKVTTCYILTIECSKIVLKYMKEFKYEGPIAHSKWMKNVKLFQEQYK